MPHVIISLKKRQAFRDVYTQGQQVASRLLVLYAYKNGTNVNRLGVSVS